MTFALHHIVVLCYNGLNLLRFVWGRTVINIIAEILKFNKNDIHVPQCLVVCLIVFSLLSPIRSLLSDLLLFGFPLLRKSKGYTPDSGLTPARNEKNNEIQPAAPFPSQNHSTGLSALFQLNSKPNSSPQRTLQSSESKKASRPDSVIMLPGPRHGHIRSLSGMPG